MNNNPIPFLGDNNGVALGVMMLVPLFGALAKTATRSWERPLVPVPGRWCFLSRIHDVFPRRFSGGGRPRSPHAHAIRAKTSDDLRGSGDRHGRLDRYASQLLGPYGHHQHFRRGA